MKEKVLIYQMGKVGSTSLIKSILDFKIQPIQIHRLFFTNNEVKLNIRRIIVKLKMHLDIFIHQYILRKRIKIITGYRDPMARNVSTFFQHLNRNYSKKEIASINYKELIDDFSHSTFFDTPNNWFDIELKRKFGIDILKNSFDKEKGYSIITNKKVDVFVYRLDKLNQLEEEIGMFLNIKNFKLTGANIGSEKSYAQLYIDFKKNYTPSDTLIKKLYTSKTINHFYSSKDIELLKNKWIKND